MIVVSDTTPLISFMKMNRLWVLKDIFGKIVIPNAVYKELTGNITYIDEAALIKECEYIRIDNIDNSMAVEILQNTTGLDAGESEAIVLAREIHADILLIDEHKGRRVAKDIGLNITGTIGILLHGYDMGLLNENDISECIISLQSSGIRVSKRLIELIQEHVRETK